MSNSPRCERPELTLKRLACGRRGFPAPVPAAAADILPPAHSRLGPVGVLARAQLVEPAVRARFGVEGGGSSGQDEGQDEPEVAQRRPWRPLTRPVRPQHKWGSWRW
jgi:hypothetical protein